MPSTSSYALPFGTFRRSLMGIGSDHNQVHSMDLSSDSISQLDRELDSFQSQVFSQFDVLSSTSDDEFLSLDWVSKLLDAFVACQEGFKIILLNNEANLSKPPLDRLLAEFFDRSIKALDICNAARDGIEKIRLWRKHLEIVSSAFDSNKRNAMGEGQFRRAKKALTDLAIVMLDDNKDSGAVFSHRNRSFGRHNKGKDLKHQHKPGHSRSLSWSVSNSWSASKQLQSMANSLILPKANEIAATDGLANTVYTMGFILMFVFWALVAAIPCQDRGLQIHFSIPRQFSWGTPLSLLHVRIMDEYKKRKNSVGLLKEVHQMEKSIHLITDLVDSAHEFPLTQEQKEEVQEGVQEVSLVCNSSKNGLDPLERQLREVFRKIMSSRTEGLDILGRAQT